MGPGTILVAAVAFGVIVLISKSIRVVQQAQTMIIERLGKYHKTLASGINFVLPVIDRPRSVDWHQTIIDRKSTRLKLQSRPHLVCRLLLEKKQRYDIAAQMLEHLGVKSVDLLTNN